MGILENTFLSSAVAVVLTFLFNNYKDWKIDIKHKLNLLNSLLSEAKAIKSLIEVRRREYKLQNINDVNAYTFDYFPISYNYFTVYESSASKIAILEKSELINYIICSYADIKGLFENLKDLSKVSMEFNKFTLCKSDNIDKTRLVLIHHSYCKMILKEQVPMVNEVLNNLIDKIENEIEIQNKKGIGDFLKGLICLVEK